MAVHFFNESCGKDVSAIKGFIIKEGDVALNKIIQSLVKEIVQLEVSGKKWMNGTLIDVGSDVIVLFNGTDFVYIPLAHIHNFEVGPMIMKMIFRHLQNYRASLQKKVRKIYRLKRSLHKRKGGLLKFM